VGLVEEGMEKSAWYSSSEGFQWVKAADKDPKFSDEDM